MKEIWILFNQLNNLKAPFANAQTLIEDALKNYSINCNAPTNGSITWIQSFDKIGIFLVQSDSRITFSNNGQQLNFASLLLTDQSYYACGLLGTRFTVVNQYFLYVRGNKKA